LQFIETAFLVYFEASTERSRSCIAISLTSRWKRTDSHLTSTYMCVAIVYIDVFSTFEWRCSLQITIITKKLSGVYWPL